MSKIFLFIFLFALGVIASPSFAEEPDDKFAVCSADNCPSLPPLVLDHEDQQDAAIVFETSPAAFMKRSRVNFAKNNNGGWQHISVNEYVYQHRTPMLGFGGAFTDSAAMLYQHLIPIMKNNLIKLYFSPQGLSYSLGRVPIGSADFSCRNAISANDAQGEPSLGPCSAKLSPYTYLDKYDASLKTFALQAEDLNYKIPMLQDALSVAKDMRLFASPWSAPAWMKNNGNIVHGSLLPGFYASWAEYFVKFLQAYQTHNIKFWAVSVQNEPEEKNLLGERFQTWQTMFYTKEEEAAFVKYYLGPSLAAFSQSYGSPIHIIIHDDQIDSIANKASILSDPNLAKYISGAGLHWYTNTDFTYKNLDTTFDLLNQNKLSEPRFILGTEACQGYLPWAKGPALGSWSRGESYAHDIISDLNHHVDGWMDWNLLLDMNGGPNWAGNYVDSPILLDLSKQTLYLQPMFFYFGHFTRFIRPASLLLASKSQGPFALEEVSFNVPAFAGLPGSIVIVVLNRDNSGRKYYIKDESKPGNAFLNLSIPGHSIQTIIYKSNNQLTLNN